MTTVQALLIVKEQKLELPVLHVIKPAMFVNVRF